MRRFFSLLGILLCVTMLSFCSGGDPGPKDPGFAEISEGVGPSVQANDMITPANWLQKFVLGTSKRSFRDTRQIALDRFVLAEGDEFNFSADNLVLNNQGAVGSPGQSVGSVTVGYRRNGIAVTHTSTLRLDYTHFGYDNTALFEAPSYCNGLLYYTDDAQGIINEITAFTCVLSVTGTYGAKIAIGDYREETLDDQRGHQKFYEGEATVQSGGRSYRCVFTDPNHAELKVECHPN